MTAARKGQLIDALQKTKIPARGLKLVRAACAARQLDPRPSKNQNPREGIETCANWRKTDGVLFSASKNQNPREGIET